MVAGRNSAGVQGYSQYTLKHGFAPNGGSCVLLLSVEEGLYYLECHGFENSKGPLSYAIGIPMDNISESDIHRA